MKFVETDLPGVIIVEPDVHGDSRGFFLETYHKTRYAEGGIVADFVQDNHSRSKGGILRGLHMQVDHLQGKLEAAVASYESALQLDPDAVESIAPPGRLVETPDDVHECGLSRPGGPHDRDEFALVDFDIHAIECNGLNFIRSIQF